MLLPLITGIVPWQQILIARDTFYSELFMPSMNSGKMMQSILKCL